jgi:cytochrome c-type biogenesis protein CcmH/NrfG
LRLYESRPGLAGIEVRIARAENAAGLYGDAETRMGDYLARRTDDADGWVQLGKAMIGRRINAGDALQAFLQALEIRPTDKTAAEEAVKILIASNRPGEARDLVGQLLLRAPGDPVLLKLRNRLQSR